MSSYWSAGCDLIPKQFVWEAALAVLPGALSMSHGIVGLPGFIVFSIYIHSLPNSMSWYIKNKPKHVRAPVFYEPTKVVKEK